MRSLICISVIVLGLTVYAQTPNAFQYQAVIRDTSGNVITSDTISLKFSILSGSVTGTTVYSETHTDTTNQFGLISIKIGNGTAIIGNFNLIDWGNNVFFLKVEIDVNAGTNYQEMGTSQLLAVPYALHAATTSDTSRWKKSTDTLYTDKMVGIGTSNPTAKLHVQDDNSSFLLQLMNMNADQGPQFYLANDQYSYLGLGLNGSTSPYSPGNAFFWLYSNNDLRFGTNNLERFLIKNDGKIGIGNSNPATALDVNGIITATGGNSNNWNTAFGWDDHATQGYLLGETDPEVGINSKYYIPFWDSSALISGSIYDSSGWVGIGTTQPERRLHIVESDWRKQFRVQRGTETIDLNPNNGTGPSEIRSSKHIAIYDDVGYLLLKNGKLGIGVSDPFERLEVDGNIVAVNYFGNGSGLTGIGDDLGNHTATSNIYLNGYWLTGDGTSGVFINNSGYTGIGTSSPLNRLAVNGGVTVGNSYIGISNVPANGLLVQGQVLIGTSYPLYSQKLVVSGDIYGKEDLYIDGGIYDSSGGSTGNDGQVLTANGTGNMSWQDQISMDYVEAWSGWTVNQVNTWLDRDLSNYGVPPFAVCEIVMVNNANGTPCFMGVRENGSSLERKIELHESESGGADAFTMHVKADENSIIEYYVQIYPDGYFYLVGWWEK
ncbi:MAG: hypothetical protein K8S16_05630 [Bacteroidales bacterium]|nr:hypothetical protein [Bacteroidales bacterium]